MKAVSSTLAYGATRHPAQTSSPAGGGQRRLMFKNATLILPLLILLFTSSLNTASAAAATQQNATTTEIEVDACLLFQLFTPSTVNDDGSSSPPSITSESAVRWAATVLLAVEHVNTRNCTILGPGCENLITPLGAQLKINPIILDLQDFSPRLAAVAAVRCSQVGGQYMLGPTTSAQSDIGTQLASVSDQLLISAIATSPALSDKDLYPNFARTAYSDGSLANAVVLLFKELGWKQAALLHNRDLFGTGYADAFTRSMTDNQLDYRAISLGAVVTEESVRTAISDLKQSGKKVVCIITFQQEYPKILRAARDILGKDYSKYTFVVGGTPVQEVLTDNEEVFREEPELLTMMEGMIGISATLNAERAEVLKMPLVNYRPKLEGALRQGLARGQETQTGTCQCGNSTAEESAEAAQEELDAVQMAPDVDAVLDIEGDLGDMYILHCYNLAWALATAVTATIEDSGRLVAPTGAEIIPLIREERVPGFSGAIGEFKWDEGGNPAVSSINVLFTSYSKRNGNSQATVDPVATWSVAEGVGFFDATPIVWADGSVYPHVPSDGLVKDMLYVYMGSGFGSAVFVAFLIFMYYRRQQAKKTNPLLGVNVKKVIRQIHADIQDMQGGKLADYIPALSEGNPNHFAIAVCTVGGKIYSVGDDAVKFTIQSAAKPFMYAHLIQLQDAEYTKQKINVEPSGLAFNSDVLSADGRPFNPLINQGAIACCSLATQGEPRQARYEQLKDFMSQCAGAPLHVDQRCYEGESATGDQNRKIAEVLYRSGCVETELDRDEGLEAYFMGCSTNVDVKELAMMGATIANKGKNPKTKTQVLDPDTAQSISSVMMSCGMYNGAGNWMMDVGLPAKSGVSGCLLAVVPGVCGIAVFSPPLNEHGNSVRGIQACTELSTGLHLHVLKKKESKSTFGSKVAGGASMMGGGGSRASGMMGGSNMSGGRAATTRTKNPVPQDLPIVEEDEGHLIPASIESPAATTRLVKVAWDGNGANNV